MDSLCKLSINNKFKFKKCVIRDEGAGFGDDDGDDMGDEFEGNADIADINRDEKASDDENIDDELDFGN